MPVALITLHSYASWMPDHPAGYVHRTKGQSAPNPRMARFYRANQAETERLFDPSIQKMLINELLDGAEAMRLDHYAIGTELSHVHTLCGWWDNRTGLQVRRSLKYSLTRFLNRRVGRRTWFSRGGHVKRVEDEDHFLELRDEYVPGHRGWKWGHRFGLYL